ncbi:hypothetical protein V1460_04440 [Streptomyces sp. SCSIO 30461]|uniref:hypothetical protein n=1 Tax=Streptomyces sp. SCSIO 30461 TaxID=3118085 RepID=UPI0030D405D7
MRATPSSVADRAQAESGWYGHYMQVLRWFLAYNGIDEGQAREIVENAVGGRFGSWIAPDVPVVDAVSSRFASGMGEYGLAGSWKWRG